MPKAVSKSQFKPQALKFFREVETTGRELVITDRGRPVLKVVLYSLRSEQILRELRGSVVAYDDPMEPVGLEDWEALK